MKKEKQQIKQTETYLVMALATTMVLIPRVHYYCVSHDGTHSSIALSVYRCGILCRCAVGYNSLKLKNIKLTVYEPVFALLIVFMLISVADSYNIQTAFFGESGRNEGFFMLLCYFLFFYTARLISDNRNRILLIHIYLAVMVLHSIYGLCQFFDVELGQRIIDTYHYAISGVAGNPNFMGSLMVMAFGVAAGMTIYTRSLKPKIIYAGFSLLFAAVGVLTRTVSAYLGISVVIIVMIMYAVWETDKKHGAVKAGILLLIMATGAVIAVFVSDRLLYGLISREAGNAVQQFMQFVHTGYADEYFASGRLHIWKNIMEMVPDNLWTGLGIDCLSDPYYLRFGLFSGRFVDKAHNELLQILITMGLPAMICYMAFYLLAIHDGAVRLKTGSLIPLYAGLFAAFLGYLTQAVFNISVIDVAPYFWLLTGIMSRPLEPVLNEKAKSNNKNRKHYMPEH